jgi:hypothetical protein
MVLPPYIYECQEIFWIDVTKGYGMLTIPVRRLGLTSAAKHQRGKAVDAADQKDHFLRRFSDHKDSFHSQFQTEPSVR